MLFDVIYADPAWRYRNLKTGGSHTSGAAQKYPTLSVEQLCAMPVRQHTASSAVLFLWATTPLGADPFEVVKAWGFTYKTKFYWHKVGRKGTGYWTRGHVEELLIAVRGPVKAWRSNIENWMETADEETLQLTSKPEGHSRKPEPVIRMIEQLTAPPAGTTLTRVELFATVYSAAVANKTSTWWNCYGLELGHNFLDPTFWSETISGASATSGPAPTTEFAELV